MRPLQELRDSCLDCVRKHLAQAAVLMSESRQQYPEHRWLAIGHMAEAADECVKEFPELAAAIREERLRYMTDLDYAVPIMDLIAQASALAGEDVTEERAERCGSVAVSLLKPGTKRYEKWLKRRKLKTKTETLDPLAARMNDMQLQKGKRGAPLIHTESAKFKPEWPETAEDGKAFVVLWADGRGIVAFKHKKDAKTFAGERGRDVVWIHYEEPVRKSGRLRVQSSYTPKTEEREVDQTTGAVTCGVFIPVPYNLARLFPDKSEEDDSVPHYTLLFAGDLTSEDYSELVDVVRRVSREYEPFTMTMKDYGEFTNNEGQRIPHMGAAPNLGGLHSDLRTAAEAAGIPIAHTYGPEEDGGPYAEQFKTHATLAYVEPDEPSYSGPRPTGSWKVTELEVWGHEKYRVPLGKLTADQPVTELERTMEELGLTRAALTEAKLSRAGTRILDFLAGIEHPESGYVLVERPSASQFSWKPFGASQKDLRPICTLAGCGYRQIMALMKKGLIEPCPGGHRITAKGRKVLEATGWQPPVRPYTMVPRHLDK